jgi:hypothetical protein
LQLVADVRHEGQIDGHGVKGLIDPDSNLKPGDVVTIFQRFFDDVYTSRGMALLSGSKAETADRVD